MSTREFNFDDLFVVYEDGKLAEVYLITEHYIFEHESIQLDLNLLKDELRDKLDQEYANLEADTDEYRQESREYKQEVIDQYWHDKI